MRYINLHLHLHLHLHYKSTFTLLCHIIVIIINYVLACTLQHFYHYYWKNIIKVSLCRKKNFKNTIHQSTLQDKKLVQLRFSTVESGKGNSKKMSLQPAPVGAKCLWCSDAGWQTVRDLRISNEEDPVTDRRTMQWWRYESRRWRRTQLSSCVDVRHTTQLVHQATIPCRQRNTTTASLN